MGISNLRNWFIPLVLLLCPSCHKEGRWRHTYLLSATKPFHSSKLIYRTEESRALSFELVHTEEGLKGYLLTHTSLPTGKYSPEHTPLTYTIDNVRCSEEGYQMRGGQRILLSPSLTQALVEALLLEKKINITLAGHKTALDGTGFAAAFEKLQDPHEPLHLFHLPWEL